MVAGIGKKIAGMLLAFMLVVLAGFYTLKDKIVLGAEAYMFGFPLVIMELTRANAAVVIGPENALRGIPRFPDRQARDVVRPNVDTLYTLAFIDMRQGPWVFEMPANQQRYELFPFMDAWTNVFAVLGTRSTGKNGGAFMLVGPSWAGPVPSGLTVLRAPTRMVWLIGRTQTNGAADYATVHQLQNGLVLRSYEDWVAGRKPPVAAWPNPVVKPATPLAQISAMDTEQFFGRLAALMQDNPASPSDSEMMRKLSHLGISPGVPPRWSVLDRWAVSLGRWLANWLVERELKKPRESGQGWVTPPANIGRYGIDYNTRAVVAMVGLGANLPEDSMYPWTNRDGSGEMLNGSRRYRIHFMPGQLPPVKAFWSITAYAEDHFFIENPLNRYALGDRDPLVFNADGSLDIWLQAEPPAEAGRQNNWLPVKRGEAFNLTARLYWPKVEALNGQWQLPAVELVP